MKEECEKLALFLSKHQGPVVLSEVRPWHRNGSLFFFLPPHTLMFLSTYGCWWNQQRAAVAAPLEPRIRSSILVEVLCLGLGRRTWNCLDAWYHLVWQHLVWQHLVWQHGASLCQWQWYNLYLSAYARQPARGPTMLAHFVASWGYVGLSWGQCGPILGLCWPILKATWADLEAYVGPCWSVWSQKIRKMGTAKKHCKTHDILRVGGPSWGLCWPILRLCGPMLGLCWPILGPCWPILELWWPILGLSWPILGAMLAHLRAMLAHLAAYVGPCWPILSQKIRKIGKKWKSTKHRKTRQFLALPGGRRQGRRPLSPTERRETPSARTRPGGPWPDLRANAPRRLRRISRPSISSQCGGWKAFGWGPASEIYSLRFLKKKRTGTLLEIDGFFGEQVSARKLLPRVFPEELLPISTCDFMSRRLCAKTSLCKSFCV